MNRYDSILEGVKPVGGTPANLVYEMKIQPRHTNYFSTLHGGMVASLVDALTLLWLWLPANLTHSLTCSLGFGFGFGNLLASLTH